MTHTRHLGGDWAIMAPHPRCPLWRVMGSPSMMATSIIGFANDMYGRSTAWHHAIGAAEGLCGVILHHLPIAAPIEWHTVVSTAVWQLLHCSVRTVRDISVRTHCDVIGRTCTVLNRMNV